MEVAGTQGIGDAASHTVANRPQKGVFRRQSLEHIPRIVYRTVVDYDYLVAMRGSCKCGLSQLHEERQILCLVFRWDNDADVGAARHRLQRLATLEALRRVSL